MHHKHLWTRKRTQHALALIAAAVFTFIPSLSPINGQLAKAQPASTSRPAGGSSRPTREQQLQSIRRNKDLQQQTVDRLRSLADARDPLLPAARKIVEDVERDVDKRFTEQKKVDDYLDEDKTGGRHNGFHILLTAAKRKAYCELFDDEIMTRLIRDHVLRDTPLNYSSESFPYIDLRSVTGMSTDKMWDYFLDEIKKHRPLIVDGMKFESERSKLPPFVIADAETRGSLETRKEMARSYLDANTPVLLAREEAKLIYLIQQIASWWNTVPFDNNADPERVRRARERQ